MNEKIKEIAVLAKIQMVSEPRLKEFAELLIKECIESVKDADTRPFVYTTFDKSLSDACKESCVKSIKQKFDIL